MIGDNVKIYPNVYICDNVVIGNNCTFDGRFMNLQAYIFGKIPYGKVDTLCALLKVFTFLKKCPIF